MCIFLRIIPSMKSLRHEKIIELIGEKDIETQEELARLLNGCGFQVTQATVSRDIREMHLEKVATPNGFKYVYPEERIEGYNKFLRVLTDGFTKASLACNIVVIKTVSGMAMAVAAAIDSMVFVEIVGSIAGDDTIMCVCASDQDAKLLLNKIYALVKNN